MTQRHFTLDIRDREYPQCLLDLARPPARVYGIGDATLLRPALGIIGSRKATPYGLSCARRFAAWAARRGITVVSGAAIGCDQAAQRAAVEAGGRTVAVMGCGADVDYPRGAAELFRTLRSEHLVVSGFAWGTPPKRENFPQRNHIIAALSQALLVVEASLPSGTFITAEAAGEIGRTVFAVPGSVYAPECRGTNRLVSQGVLPITDVSDLALALDMLHMNGDEDPLSRPAPDDPLGRALVSNPMRPDDAARELDMDIVCVMRSIARLEGKGIVTRYPDGRYGPG